MKKGDNIGEGVVWVDDANVKRIDKLEETVNTMKIDVAVAQSDIKGIKQDISTIKDDTKWLRRTITQALIGGLITIVVGVFFFLTKLG